MTGARFVDGATVLWNGDALSTTFVGAGELRARIDAARVASGGLAAITVRNPAPGGGTSSALAFTVNWSVPTLAGVSPGAAVVGSAGQVVRVTGAGFGHASVVRVNGAHRATTLLHATALDAVLPASDLAVEGTALVTVFNPEPGGGTSAGLPFRITALPILEVSPALLAFDAAEGGPNPAPRSAFIVAAGESRLSGLTAEAAYEVGQPGGWLALALSSSVSPAALAVTVNVTGLGAGTHRATIRLSAAAAANTPVDMPVELTVTARPPVLAVSPGSVSRLLHQGAAFFYPEPADTLVVTNAGGGTIEGLSVQLTYIDPCSFDWIRASLTTATTPARVVIDYDSIRMCWSLFPTTNRVDLEITSATPGVAPVTVPIALTIRPADHPQVTTLPATDITPTSAVLRGDLVGQGVYGVLLTMVTDTISGGSGQTIIVDQAALHSQTFVVPVTGLQPGTRYFFWFTASDYGECNCTGSGSKLSFTTPASAPARGATSPARLSSAVRPGGPPRSLFSRMALLWRSAPGVPPESALARRGR